MSTLQQVERVLRDADLGFLTTSEMLSGVAYAIDQGLKREDPEVPDAMIRALTVPGLEPHLLAELAWAASRAEIAGWKAVGAATSLRDVRDAIVERATRALEDEPTPERRGAFLGALPGRWTRWSMVETLLATVDGASRILVLRSLLRTIRHHRGDAGALDLAVRPYLEADDGDAVRLLADAYLFIRHGPDLGGALRAYFARHLARMDPDEQLRLAVRCSIEGADGSAASFARNAVDGGLSAARAPVAGMVLWLAGEREAGRTVASAFEPDLTGWFTQAADSLVRFIRASDGTPDEQLELLAPPVSTATLIRRPATVGALVARSAHMRMRAFGHLRRWEEAVAEAASVVATAGYRNYNLHLQLSGAEFDVRLVDRLAVTPDELREAQELLDTHPGIEQPSCLVIEGRIVWGAPGSRIWRGSPRD